LLNDVDAACIRAARITPRDRIVAGDTARGLQESAHDRIARGRRAIEQGHPGGDFFAGEQLGVDAVEPHRIAAPRIRVEIGVAVREIDDAARAVHHVEIEIGGQAFPQL
jgi:hypothetical protein